MQIFRRKSIDNNTFSRNSSQFLKNSSQIPCTFRFLSLPLPSLKFSCGAFHINKGRDDMFKPNQLFFDVGAYFFAHNCRIDTEGRAPFVYVEHSTLCGDADRQNTAVRLPRVFLPFVVDNMRVLADEEVRAAFFVPLRQPVPGGSRQ